MFIDTPSFPATTTLNYPIPPRALLSSRHASEEEKNSSFAPNTSDGAAVGAPLIREIVTLS